MRIHTIGGYNEVGKNMTVIEDNGEAVVCDMGFFLPTLIDFEEEGGDRKNLTSQGLISLGAIPDDSKIRNLNIKAIVGSHCHLDHIGAIPYLVKNYKAPIIGTPYTTEVLKTMIKDERLRVKNEIKSINPNSYFKASKNIEIELINITHSTLQASMIAIHTKKGTVLYANDFKFDNHPVLGRKPNFQRLRKLGKGNVIALIVESIYAYKDMKTPSEKVAREMLKDVLLGTENTGNAILATTFASHIARLKSILDFGNKLNRKVVFLGRSMMKYIKAAENLRLIDFSKAEVIGYSNKVKSKLKEIERKKDRYLIICTGNQGEPNSVLSRIADNQLHFKFDLDDHVIFSCKTIPAPINEANRALLEEKLKKKKVRMFKDIHVSVLPDTEVVINDKEGMKITEIGSIKEKEKKDLKVPAFDPSDLKIKWYNAKVVQHDYKGKIFNIKTKSGRSVSITSGHSLFKLEKGAIVPEKGDNLKEGDYLAIPKKFSWYKQLDKICIEDYIDLNCGNYSKKGNTLFFNKIPICPLRIKLTKEFARLLGYYLAEGSAPRHISFVIGKHEEEILKDINNSITKCFPGKVHIVDKGNSYEIYFGARTLRKLFKTWFGENAKSKKIPKFVFSTSDRFKLNFLGAYINGDGTIDKGKKYVRIRVKTASKKLASDLLYLFSHIGICAKFDHIEKGRPRLIGKSRKEASETLTYVLRIQGIDNLIIIKDFLSNKFKQPIEHKLANTRFSQQLPPESLPIEKLNLNEIEPKKGTYLYNIKYYREHCKEKKKHISQKLITKQSNPVGGFMSKILNGHLLFDPITKIETFDYEGKVYDFSVVGPENFIGGFGGIILHNSGHSGREDLRDLIKMVRPQNIIPAHGDITKLTALGDLATEMGYELGKDVHLMSDGRFLEI
jgi:ribonuclease J